MEDRKIVSIPHDKITFEFGDPSDFTDKTYEYLVVDIRNLKQADFLKIKYVDLPTLKNADFVRKMRGIRE